jgi:hypothetical protein
VSKRLPFAERTRPRCSNPVQGRQKMHFQTQAPARNPSCSTTSTSERSASGLVLACVILAACANASSPLSALEGDQKPAPKSNPVKPRAAGPGSGTTPAGAGNADLLQRRRRGIAEHIEAHYYLRGLISGGAAKIVDAKLAGPFEDTVTDRHLFSPNVTSTATWYCVTAKLMVPIPAYPRAEIRVEHPPEGGERMTARISHVVDFPRCKNADYKPFPEMEQLRVQRRRALGHED